MEQDAIEIKVTINDPEKDRPYVASVKVMRHDPEIVMSQARMMLYEWTEATLELTRDNFTEDK